MNSPAKYKKYEKEKSYEIYSIKKLSLYLFYTILGICEENVMMI